MQNVSLDAGNDLITLRLLTINSSSVKVANVNINHLCYSQKVQDVVSEVTVKALKEFSSGSFHPEDGQPSPQGSRQGSRPTSAVQGSRPPSGERRSRPGSSKRPASLTGSRPSSAHSQGQVKTPVVSKPGTPSGSKAGTPLGSKPGTPSGSKPATPSGSKPSTPLGSKPATPSGSKAGTPAGSKTPTPQVSRPQSADKDSRPASAVGSRPRSSARGSRPGSVQRSRPSTAQGAEDEQGLVVSGSRPGSAQQGPITDQPVSGQATPGRPGSGRPLSDRPGSGRPSSDRPGSGRPPSGRPKSRTSDHQPQDGDQQTPPPPVPEPTHDDLFHEDNQGDRPPDQQHTNVLSRMTLSGNRRIVIDVNSTNDMNDKLKDGYVNVTFPVHISTGGGDDGGDSGEEDDEDEMAVVDDDEEEEEEDSEGESEMVVLDPDHPLMRRFQKALQDHLNKQREKVSLELRELLEAVKTKHTDREDIGVELYGVQQELARHQMMLEKHHDDYSKLNQGRTQMEQLLYDVRTQYKDKQTLINEERKKGADLQAEVENLALRLFYMDNAKEDVRSDIAVMKRAAEKAESEVMKAEVEKQQQDLYVDRLVEQVDKLREEIALFDAQLTAQSEETRAAKEALMEARMEIESISLEKKQLYQQWNSSLIGMRRRDEAHAAMQEALNQQEQRILSLQTEIEGFKKSISREQEQNEKLTLILSKTEQDIATVKKMLTSCQNKHEALKTEYATYTRMLHETEQALNRANTDKTLRMNELNALRKQIEKEYAEKVRLEDAVVEQLRSQLTLDKAAQYTDKLIKQLHIRMREMDQQVAVVENDISKETLEVSHTRARAERLKNILEELDEEIKQKNEIISKSEADIVKRNAMIERKQGIIDQYNKKLEQMIAQAGGVELGPLEIQINSLHKSIEAEQQEIVDLKQMWLRDQNELVALSKENDNQNVSVLNLKKQITILSQKKLRIEGEISSQNCETNDIKRSIRNMENDMMKLNMLLHKESRIEHSLEKDNVLMENEFIGSLKEAEMASIKMQETLDNLREEKERLLNSLVEAERQIMLWEKKTQLAKETRAAVDSEIGQCEIRAMKAEIHRMQVRYTQLMKQQERMIQEMEKAVSRRDTIVSRGDAQAKTNKKEANHCDEELQELRQHQQALAHQLEEKQLNVQQLQNNSDTLDGDVERLLENKQRNMAELLARQQKAKYYQQVKDGRYTRLCRTDAALDNELQKQVDRMQNMTAIIERLSQEYPHIQPGLRRVMLAFGSRGTSIEGGD
ncbi:hypothetical protein LSH36_339g05000 [Paralvinella palmiformis]|uniref:Coiled-coil domain-containing protein 40 n=1 Tax=Paralvinella palmiformis TaxID=53620 RepID=A0AAD9N2S5_9ANNE|nr:hypothetical protein LSH36_339g05000 [Paralvinella palmiformis]